MMAQAKSGAPKGNPYSKIVDELTVKAIDWLDPRWISGDVAHMVDDTIDDRAKMDAPLRHALTQGAPAVMPRRGRTRRFLDSELDQAFGAPDL